MEEETRQKKSKISGVDEMIHNLEHHANEKMGSKLKDAYNLFAEISSFKPGMLVRWKHGMRNRRHPEYDMPAIVIEKLSEAVISSENDSGSIYFREPLDLILGVLDKDQDLVCFHYDSRRFENWEI